MKYPNGKIPSAALRSIGDGQALQSGAAASWLRLLAAAKADGITLTLTDSYRPLAVQERIFLARYVRQAEGGGYYGDSRPYKGMRYVRKRGTASAAVPGTSNHGIGLAVDVAGTSYPVGGTAGAAYRWLVAHAGRFGWQHPSWATTASYWEPWHWEYSAASDRSRPVWHHIVRNTGLSDRAALYRGRKTGRVNITRRRKIGRNLKVVRVAGRWAQTAKGDWIKKSKLRKGKI